MTIFVQMKLPNFDSKQLESYFKNNEKYLEICFKNLGKSWNSVIGEKKPE